jgi:hypothetical protein
MLIRAAEGSPAWMTMARIAMLRAINHGRERVFSDRKETHWGSGNSSGTKLRYSKSAFGMIYLSSKQKAGLLGRARSLTYPM